MRERSTSALSRPRASDSRPDHIDGPHAGRADWARRPRNCRPLKNENGRPHERFCCRNCPGSGCSHDQCTGQRAARSNVGLESAEPCFHERRAGRRRSARRRSGARSARLGEPPLDAPPWFVQATARGFGPVSVPAGGFVLRTGGGQAARLRPERLLDSLQPSRQRHGRVHRRRRVTAGTTLIPAGPRASGTSARKFKSRGQIPCANN
jgi:hypothetical protein